MSTVLITGTSRGLGLALTKIFSASPSTGLVFATARASSPPPALAEVIDSSKGRVKYVSLDIESPESIQQAVAAVTSQLSSSKGLDILINNAGIQIFEPEFIKTETLTKILNTNVIAVHNVISAFLPLLRAGEAKKIINMTSTLGSIALVDSFALSPTPSYKISKAALNMLNAQYALELGKEGFTSTVISPGWLKTDLGGDIADLPVEQGANAVFKIIDGLQKENDSGAFRNIYAEGWEIYDGKNAPW